MEIRAESSLRPQVELAVERNSILVRALLPEAEVEHIGATSVPEALTKGDVDLLARVRETVFEGALERLRGSYRPHFPEEWTPTLASFKEEPEHTLPVGIQLVVAGGVNDRLFISWRERLRADPELLARYNAFKTAHAADEYDPYTEAKGRFIEEVLGRGLGPE